MVNENEFFRQATLRICGHLDIEKAMHACLSYLSSEIPVTKITNQGLTPLPPHTIMWLCNFLF